MKTTIDGTGIGAATLARSRPRKFLDRILSRPAMTMLWRNTVVSCSMFVSALLLLWLVVEKCGVAKTPAAALSFLFASSLHYLFGRTWIFRGTQRGVADGYFYFLINAAVGLVVTTALFAVIIKLTTINYLIVRILVSVVAGLVMFLLNATLNFRRL